MPTCIMIVQIVVTHSCIVPPLQLRLKLTFERSDVIIDRGFRLREELIDDALGNIVEKILESVELTPEL